MKNWAEFVALWDAINAYAAVVNPDDANTKEQRMRAVVAVNLALAKYAGFDQPDFLSPDEGSNNNRVDVQAEHNKRLHGTKPTP